MEIKKNSVETTAINFLIFNYFGITLASDWKTVVRASIIKAYDDATNQGAYNAMFTKDLNNLDTLKEKSDTSKKTSAKLIEEKVDKLLNEDKQPCNIKSYSDWHNNLCNSLCDNYKDIKINRIPAFSYGNAQKWVNMTVKYIYMLDCFFDNLDNNYHNQIEKYKNYFDIPIDRYIIQSIWKEKSIPLPCDDKLTAPWSKWDEPTYDKCQDSLKRHLSGKCTANKTFLEWENDAWIEQKNINKQREHKDIATKIKEFFNS